MVQTRSQRRNRRREVVRRIANRLRIANSTPANPIYNQLPGRRRALYMLNAAQRIGQSYQRYRRYMTARMALNRRLPSDMSRLIGRYL